jgi:hypothetical protein
MDFTNYIDPRLGIIVIVLWCIGLAIKQIKSIQNEYIPILLSIISIGLVSAFLKELSGNSIIQGILCAASAIYGNQLLKQANQKIEQEINTTVK